MNKYSDHKCYLSVIYKYNEKIFFAQNTFSWKIRKETEGAERDSKGEGELVSEYSLLFFCLLS